jgi:hypothetical protein
VGCALLNRVRGGGLYGDILPGRALLWVAPAIGGLALIFHPWPIALAFGVGFLIWGLPGWSYLLCRIAGIAPPRSASTLEAACCVAPGVIAPFFLRMLFVLPGVAAVGAARPVGLISTVPDDEPPDEPAKTYDDEDTVIFVQSKLRALGYSKVGTADGDIGDFTRKAIVLYRGDKGLAYSDKIDDPLILSLATDKEKRKQPEGRADATPAQVRERVRDSRLMREAMIKHGLLAIVGLLVVALGTAVWLAIKGGR